MPAAKKPSTRLVRKAMRELLEPEIARLGFVGKYPDWRRETPAEYHYLQFYTRKYGGGFSFSGAWAEKGRFTDPNGKVFDTADWTIAHTDFDQRASAVRMIDVCKPDRTMARESTGYFEYAHIADDADACRSLVLEARAVLPQMDRWLHTREAGEAISSKDHSPPQGLSRRLRWHMATAMVDAFDLSNEPPSVPGSNPAG
ncbi:hypothetical protein [Croceicoccus naphthovorans]|uniref:Uncharacterized protein n=1 Tax=Croceicoccus naphthovorans TaxID=1348774 RepID=A0A0G3XGW8_9SPHN|nr:hypothetical protein [Croceicoccus naphthovorans]AKM10447.1 hypothetical protein AB433_11525 [Croceicoccus naphthovorans]MBB3988617.1 hypothetical protein [Croceicoccus naphthovorans]